MTVSEQLDEILGSGAEGEYVVTHNSRSALYMQAVSIGASFQLLKKRPNTHHYDLTQRAYEVLEAGGFENWKAANKKREDEAHQATLDSAKATVDAAKYARQSKNAAWFSGIFGAVAVVIAAYQLWKSNETDSKINELTKRVESTDSIRTAQLQSQTINLQSDYRLSVDSSFRQAVPLSAPRETEGTPMRKVRSPTK